jgi:hypothetical protein
MWYISVRITFIFTAGDDYSPVETTIPSKSRTATMQRNADSVGFGVDPTLLNSLTGFKCCLGQFGIVAPLQTDWNQSVPTLCTMSNSSDGPANHEAINSQFFQRCCCT